MSVPTPSPNIWGSPQVYERLNRAADPEGLVAAALDEAIDGVPSRSGPVAPDPVAGETAHAGVALAALGLKTAPDGPSLAVDIGCGAGFHLPMLAARARRVVGVEPHRELAEMAQRRVARARLDSRVDVRVGLAERLPLESGSADLVFSHWAYFFGPGCEPGLREAERVLRPGGIQVAVDLDVTATQGYAAWFAASSKGAGVSSVRGDRTATFFAERGWHERRLPVVWSFEGRGDLDAVLSIEFPPEVAARASRETVGTTIAVPTVLRWRVASPHRPVRPPGPTSLAASGAAVPRDRGR